MSQRVENMPRRRRGASTEERERWIMIAIAIAFVALMPSVVLGALLWREIDHRTAENRDLIERVQQNEERQETARIAVRKAIRQADIENCQEDEIVKQRLRQIVAFDPEDLAFTLEQLGIDPDSTRGRLLTQRSRHAATEAVHALRPRNCSKLPDPTEPKP